MALMSDLGATPDHPVLSQPMQLLIEAVAAVAAQSPADLPEFQALAEAGMLLRQLDTLRAVGLARVADVDKRGLHTHEGAPSTATWVAQQQTGMDRSEVALARRLDRMPRVSEQVLAGGLRVEAAQRISAALEKLRRHVDRPDGEIHGQDADAVLDAVIVDGVSQLVAEGRGGLDDDDLALSTLLDQLRAVAASPMAQLARLEAAFLLLAGNVEAGQLVGALARLVDAVLPNQLEQRSQTGHAGRGFGLQRSYDGSGWQVTDGDLDLECGELLFTLLQSELATDPDNPSDTEAFAELREQGWQTGDEVDGCAGPRSLRQRRHDALKLGLRRYLDSGIAGTRDKVAPHVGVTLSIDALHGAPGALPARSDSGTNLPLSLVRRWLCDSAVTRFVLSLGRKVVETSHTERTLKAHERRAKHVETGGMCQGAGCARGPGHRLVPHHPVPYARCGTTSLADTVLVCEQTHHDIHQGHKTIKLKDGRYLGPDGWVSGPRG